MEVQGHTNDQVQEEDVLINALLEAVVVDGCIQ